MNNRKILIIIIIVISLFTACNSKNNKKPLEFSNKKDEELIGTSNEKNNDRLQAKVIIDYINIREQSNVNSKKLGIVKKDSIFNVIDYKKENKYVWLHIKTNNNIDGYIASEINNSYVEFYNDKIDISPPTLKLLKDKITVKYRNDLNLDLIKNNIVVEDDSENVEISYSIDYDNAISSREFRLTVTAKDIGNNVSSKKFILEIANEKQLSDKRWITYDEVQKQRKKYESICKKYKGTLLNDFADCSGNSEGANWRRQSDGSVVVEMPGTQIYQTGIWCVYKKVNVIDNADCWNGNDIVSYTMVEDTIKNTEKRIFNIVEKYEKECFESTGYTYNDLKW